MIPGRPRCSEEALGRDEPLFATASLVTTWLLIEQPGAWGPDALVDSGFPTDSARPLMREATRLRIRILAIRRRETEGTARTVFLVHSGGDGLPPQIVVGSVSDPATLVELDLAGLARGQLPDFGSVVDGPVYLVCTHGRHDICCADKGRPLYRELAELRPDQTWEVSHLGGDRFAGNLVVLPRGDYFGRVAPDDVGALVSEYETQELAMAHHRGRSIQPRLVQAAEHFLRTSRSLTGFDDLDLIGYRRPDHDHAEVVFRDNEKVTHRVRLAARVLPEPVFMTCRAEQPGQTVAYDLVSLETVG
ncbi:MAG: sucrase ferredoxin [Acidimicrobiia bacterium]